MKKIGGFLLMLFASSVLMAAEEGAGGVLYGDEHAFGFTAPRGWVLDAEAGRPQGLDAVFYPTGSSWEKSAGLFMYANTTSKGEIHNTVKDLVSFTLERLKGSGNPNVKAVEVKTVVAGNPPGKTGTVYHFTGDKFGRFEAVAYFDEGESIDFFVLSSASRKDFNDSLSAFEALAQSHVLVANNVELKDGPTKAWFIGGLLLAALGLFVLVFGGRIISTTFGSAPHKSIAIIRWVAGLSAVVVGLMAAW